MAYATGSITDANSSLALYTALASLLTTAGYTLVDTVVISTRTHKVWKSAAANNSMNLDWYLDVAYTTTGVGPLHLTPFEYFDPATDLGYRGAYNGNDTTIEGTYHSRYGATGYALESNWSGANSGAGVLTAAATFAFWFSVTGDRVIALSSLAPSFVRYAGFYDMHPNYAAAVGAKAFPLIKLTFDNAGYASQGASGCGVTRLPPVTNMTTVGSWYYQGAANPEVYLLISQSALVPNNDAAGVSPYACRVRVGSATPSANKAPTYMGWLKDVLVVPLSGSVVRGDTVTLSGDTYVCVTGTNDTGVIFKAA